MNRFLTFVTLFLSISVPCLVQTVNAQTFLDPGFGNISNGVVIEQPFGPNSSSGIEGLLFLKNNKILAVSSSDGGGNTFGAIRFNDNGGVDSSFGNNGRLIHKISNSTSGWATTCVEQPDSKFIIAGNADMGSGDIAVARFHANGTVDNSFGNTGEVVLNVYGHDMGWDAVLQNDGKIVLCGDSKSGEKALVLRLNSDGSLDTTFNNTGVFTTSYSMYSNVLRSVIIKPDGKILAGGYTSDGFLLLQLLPNGNLDSSFGNNGAVITGGVGLGKDIALQVDGKVVMVGREIFNDGYVVRYMPDGRIDSSFATNGIINIKHPLGDLGLEAVAIDGAGNIYASGFVYDGPSGNSDEDMFIIRLDSTGKKDPTFGGPNGIVTSLSSYTERTYDMLLQPDGKILTGGSVDIGQNRVNYALIRYLPFPVNVQEVQAKDDTFSIYPNPVTERLFIKTNAGNSLPDNAAYRITDISGKEIQSGKLKRTIDISTLNKGSYILIINHNDTTLSTHFLKQ